MTKTNGSGVILISLKTDCRVKRCNGIRKWNALSQVNFSSECAYPQSWIAIIHQRDYTNESIFSNYCAQSSKANLKLIEKDNFFHSKYITIFYDQYFRASITKMK